MQRKSLALKQFQATVAAVDTVVALREEAIKTQHFFSPAANGILILFGSGETASTRTVGAQSNVPMLMKQLEFFSAGTTNETWAGRGDTCVIEMLIKFLEEKLQLGHLAIAGLYSHDSASTNA